MRFPLFSLLFLLLWAGAYSSAWSPEDREIFALKEAVEKDQGPGTTFYSWLGISKSSNEGEITKAYRKMSRKLHPDKNPGQQATDRFARLGVVANVLRSARRERYDFYLKHGFPKYRNGDYSYKRYRPGLGAVLIFLYLFGGAAQYLALRITAGRQRAYMQSIIDDVTNSAWGNGISSTKRKVVQPNGKAFVVYPTGNVFLVENETEFWLNPEDVRLPTIHDTFTVKFPKLIITKLTGHRFLSQIDGVVLGESEELVNEEVVKKSPIPKPSVKTAGARRKNRKVVMRNTEDDS